MKNSSMLLDFDKYAAEGNEILNMLASDLKITRVKAAEILCAVLYALRSRISIDESLQIVAKLPMALKALYVNQWDPWQSFHRVHDVEEFVKEVRRFDKSAGTHDFEQDEYVRLAILGVFRALTRYVSEGEFRNILAALPGELKQFVNRGLGQRRMPL